jgi:hypothetical protein
MVMERRQACYPRHPCTCTSTSGLRTLKASLQRRYYGFGIPGRSPAASPGAINCAHSADSTSAQFRWMYSTFIGIDGSIDVPRGTF